jgi:hypothetical protein
VWPELREVGATSLHAIAAELNRRAIHPAKDGRVEGRERGAIAGAVDLVAPFQSGAITSRASYVLPGTPWRHNESGRETAYAETRLFTDGTCFGNDCRSGPPAMRAAKRNGPSVQVGHSWGAA